MRLSSKCNAVILSALLAAVVALTGCARKSDNSLMALAPFLPGQCPALTVPAGATVVDSGSAWIERGWHCYYLLRLEYDGNDPSFAMWIPPLEDGVKPAVVLTQPYDYITWNGDTAPDGVDVKSNAEYVRDAVMHLLNGCGVLYVFERYYAGGSIRNDVDDTVAGLRFLADSGVADNTKIGIWGGSWGGFEALYGAADAPSGAVPIAGVAFFPLSDFADEVDYIENSAGVLPNHIPDITDDVKRGQYQAFFEPYLERIKAVSDWADWDGTALLAKLSTPFIVVHDEWDTLVPFEQTVALAEDPSITPLYFYQGSSRDLNALPYGWSHGELRMYRLDETPPPPEGIVFGIANTLASAYLFTRIAADDRTRTAKPILIGYEKVALNDFMAYIRDIKCNGTDEAVWAAELLQDCADGRVLMIEMSDGTYGFGDEIIAKAFSDAGWGDADYTMATTVRTALGVGLPDCP